jgi:non-canonical purine NTP pyrophosphatase (RdgB/HAM1 family)
VKLFLASSNPGKLREYRELAGHASLDLELLPNFAAIPVFEETASTFAENSAGKALYYSRFCDGTVLADDSGLVVPALGGAPGVYSARYAGPNATDTDCIRKLLNEMKGKSGEDRRARFVCVTTIANQGRALAVVSDSAEGSIATLPSGDGGFGYDPVFYYESLGRTYAEISPAQKNSYSHRGKSLRKILYVLSPSFAATFG